MKKKIGMFFSVLAIAAFFISAPVSASTQGPDFYNDPGYGDID